MAQVIITLKDEPNGDLNMSLQFDPPIAGPAAPAEEQNKLATGAQNAAALMIQALQAKMGKGEVRKKKGK